MAVSALFLPKGLALFKVGIIRQVVRCEFHHWIFIAQVRA
jgi:hypothetical protein